MSTSQPDSYSRSQIFLHWLIAALVVFQLVFGESIKDYGRALRRDGEADALTWLMGNLHIWIGIAVLVLMVARLGLRLTHGAPAPVPAPKLQDMASKAVHALLYLLLFVTPVTGLVAWYLDIHEVGDIHELAKPAFIILITLHVLGALWHKFVLKDGTMQRMVSSKAA